MVPPGFAAPCRSLQYAQWLTAYEDHHARGFQRVYPCIGKRSSKVRHPQLATP